MVSAKLVWRNLMRHPLRSILTVGSLTVALFLVCSLQTLITTLTAGMEHADATRVLVMSDVSLFADLPLSYQDSIRKAEGVHDIVKWQWFGGYYKDPDKFFGQFAVDPERMFEVYPECQLGAAEKERFLGQRNACIVGDSLARQYDWKVGDKVPLIGALFPHPGGGAWEFEIAGVYTSGSPTFDNQTLIFQYKYLQETLEADGQTPGVGVFSIKLKPGASPEQVIQTVEALFENGPQRVKCDTEAEFQRQFVTMMGDLPFFMRSIGLGVLIAILLASVNTMLMSAREQVRDIGVLKALGFTDRGMSGLLIAQAMCLCAVGGGLGMLVAALSERSVADFLGAMFPNYNVVPSTYLLAAAITVGLGLVAGIVPGWQAGRLRCVEALRATE